MPYEQMLKAAAPVKVKFDELLDTILVKLKSRGVSSSKKTGLKSVERGTKKVQVDYAGNFAFGQT